MDRELYKGYKFYLSSMTGRKCKYWIFNLLDDKNIVIATNGDVINKNNILLEYCSPDLSIHYIKFKNMDIIKNLKDLFNLSDNLVLRLDTRQYCSIMNKVKESDDITYKFINNELLLYINDTPFIIGDIFDNFIAAMNLILLINYANNMNNLYKSENQVILDVLSDKVKNSSILVEIDIANNKYKNLLLDGLDCVSIKEFIKKLEVPFSFKLIYWIIHNSRIEFITQFESDELLIKSFRPHFRLFLLK